METLSQKVKYKKRRKEEEVEENNDTDFKSPKKL